MTPAERTRAAASSARERVWKFRAIYLATLLTVGLIVGTVLVMR